MISPSRLSKSWLSEGSIKSQQGTKKFILNLTLILYSIEIGGSWRSGHMPVFQHPKAHSGDLALRTVLQIVLTNTGLPADLLKMMCKLWNVNTFVSDEPSS